MFGRLSAAYCNNQLAEGCNVDNGRSKGICAPPRLHHTLQHRNGYSRCTRASSSSNTVNVHAAVTSVLACEADDAVHELLVHVVHGASNSNQPHQQQIQPLEYTQQQQQWRQRGSSDMPQLPQHSQLLEQHWQQLKQQQQQHNVGQCHPELVLQEQQQLQSYSPLRGEVDSLASPEYWQPDMQLQTQQQQACAPSTLNRHSRNGSTSTYVQHLQIQSHVVQGAAAAAAVPEAAVEVTDDRSSVLHGDDEQPAGVDAQQLHTMMSSRPDMSGWTKREMLQGWRHNRQDNIARTAAGVALMRITSKAAPHRVATSALSWLLKEQQVILSAAGAGLSYRMLECLVQLMHQQQQQHQQQLQQPGQQLSQQLAGGQAGPGKVLVTVHCRTSPRPNGGRVTIFDLLCQLKPAVTSTQHHQHTQQQHVSLLHSMQQLPQLKPASSSVDGNTQSTFHHSTQLKLQNDVEQQQQQQQQHLSSDVDQALSHGRCSPCCSLSTVPGSETFAQQVALTYSCHGRQHSSSSSSMLGQDVQPINALGVPVAPPGAAWRVPQEARAELPTLSQPASLERCQQPQHHPEWESKNQQQWQQRQQQQQQRPQQQLPLPTSDDVDQLLLQVDQLLSEADVAGAGAAAGAAPAPVASAAPSAGDAASAAVPTTGAAASCSALQVQVAGHPFELADSIGDVLQSGAAVVAPVAYPKQAAKLLEAVSLASRALQLSRQRVHSSSSSSSTSDLQHRQLNGQHVVHHSSLASRDVCYPDTSLTAESCGGWSHQAQLVLEPRACLLQRQSKMTSGMLVYMYCAPCLVHQR